ncbi:MAG: hypothetical protein RL021_1570 [Bacteroidota bacterium]
MATPTFNELSRQLIDTFDAIDEVTLNSITVTGKWSIGQCIDHIRRTNAAYIPALESLLKPDHKPNFWERNSPFTDSIGKSMILQLGTAVNRRYKAPRLFQPSVRGITKEIVVATAEQLIRFEGIFRELEERNALSKVVRSPVSPLITIRAGDLLESLKGHTARHLAQAGQAATVKGI